jgi:hypothetical protein
MATVNQNHITSIIEEGTVASGLQLCVNRQRARTLAASIKTDKYRMVIAETAYDRWAIVFVQCDRIPEMRQYIVGFCLKHPDAVLAKFESYVK